MYNLQTMKYFTLITTAFILTIFLSFKKESAEVKIAAIDKYVSHIDSNLNIYIKQHSKCCDCFGTDTYYKDSLTIVKIHNYQSCFNVDYYYDNNRLVLATIDGSFKRNCGWTEANYCWDSTMVRDYKARIYYDRNEVIKDIESGSKPCCEIRPCGNYKGVIDFDKKAKVILEMYGDIRNKQKE
jgi:hypothetical protein